MPWRSVRYKQFFSKFFELINLGFIYLIITIFAFGLSLLLGRLPYLSSVVVVVAIVVFIFSFTNIQYSLYLLIFSMLLSPEIGAGGLGGDSATTSSRGMTIRAEDLILLVIGFAWLARIAIKKDVGMFRTSSLNQPIAYYVFICLFATGVGFMVGRVNGLTGFLYVLKYIEYFIIYFMTINYIQTRDQVTFFIKVLFLTAAIVVFIAILQIPSGERISAPFEGDQPEPNTLGGYLIFVGALALGLAMECKRGMQRFLLWVFVGLLIITMLFTLSRGSYLSIPFCLLTLIFLYKTIRIKIIIYAVFLGGGLLVGVPSTIKKRVEYTVDQRYTQQDQVTVMGITLDTSTTARIRSWQKVLRDIVKSPFWGLGVTGYSFLDAQYPRTLIETGFIGLALFVKLIFSIFSLAFRLRKLATDWFYQGLANGMIIGLVALLMHGLSANTFIIVRIMEPFWLVVGLIFCCEQILLEERINEGKDQKLPAT